MYLFTTTMIHAMHHAKAVFHKSCTGISYAIQGILVYKGVRDLSAIAKAKYGIDDHNARHYRDQQDAIKNRYKHAVSFIQETLRNKGIRGFNDPDRYKGVLLIPSILGSKYGASSRMGDKGAIFLMRRV